MSQKAQKRISNQKRVEVVWAGPAVVREQRAVSRVSIGHRGAVKVRSTGGRYADKSRGWLALQICHCICENASQRCKMRFCVQQWAAQFRAGIRAAKSELISGAGTATELVKCRRFIRMFARRRDPGDIFRRICG